MMAVQITCNGCGFDLTDTGNSVAWRLALTVEQQPTRDGYVTDMMIYPPLPVGTYHFCGLPCLNTWRAKTTAPDAHPSTAAL